MAARNAFEKKCLCGTKPSQDGTHLIHTTCLTHTEIRLALCEQDAVILKPHVAYRFYVDQSCDKCMAYEGLVIV